MTNGPTRRIDHALAGQSLGQQTTLTSLHIGTAGARPKAYLQASLHAGELPGMLALHHLRPMLEAAAERGELIGEVVLVPVANPIGLAQRIDHTAMGRFELRSSENFNRHFPDLAAAVFDAVRHDLGADPQANVERVRSAVALHLAQLSAPTALQAMRRTLLQLAHDADVVLDLHCDCEAVVHVYSEHACWDRIEPLARLLGARAALLASDTGSGSFDECCSGLWWQLASRLAAADGPARPVTPLPQACASATVELRGESDVKHPIGRSDAEALYAYLQTVGVVAGPAPDLPPPACTATPLAGSQTIKAPHAGLLVFRASPGDKLVVGDPVVDVIDPLDGRTTCVRSEVDGVLYAHVSTRFALANDDLAKVAGPVAFRSGRLLGH